MPFGFLGRHGRPDPERPVDPEPSHAPEGYVLAWEEDFSDFRIDAQGGVDADGGKRWRSRYPWTYDTPYSDRTAVRNREEQLFVERGYLGRHWNPHVVRDGVLRLRNRRATAAEQAVLPRIHNGEIPHHPENYRYWGGMMSSEYFYAGVWGYLEAKVRVPNIGNGHWAGFWTHTPWGSRNEIDVFEMLGHESLAAGPDGGHVHFDWHEHEGEPRRFARNTPRDIHDVDRTVWRVYGCEFGPGGMRYFIDGVERSSGPAVPWREMMLILNMQYSSIQWGFGTPGEDIPDVDMEIAWVRWFVRPGDGPVLIREHDLSAWPGSYPTLWHLWTPITIYIEGRLPPALPGDDRYILGGGDARPKGVLKCSPGGEITCFDGTNTLSLGTLAGGAAFKAVVQLDSLARTMRGSLNGGAVATGAYNNAFTSLPIWYGMGQGYRPPFDGLTLGAFRIWAQGGSLFSDAELVGMTKDPGPGQRVLPERIFAVDADRSTITYGTEATIARIDDLGTGGKHFAQSDAARQPTHDATGINGRPSMQGNGNELLLRSEGLVWPAGDFAVYVLVKASAQLDRRVYAETHSTNGNAMFAIGTRAGSGGDKLRVYVRSDTGAVLADVLSTATVFDDTPHVVCVSRSGGTGQIWIDGVLDEEFAIAAGAITPNRSAVLGRQGAAGPADQLTGHTAAVYAYRTPRSVDQAAEIETYLANYGGVTPG